MIDIDSSLLLSGTASAVLLPATSRPAAWEWRDDAGYVAYAAEVSRAIEAAFQRFKAAGAPASVEVNSGSLQLIISFANMSQAQKATPTRFDVASSLVS